MVRFYGFSHSEVCKMSYKDFSGYRDSIEVLKANEALLDIKIANYSDMKKQDRDKFRNLLDRASKNFDRREKLADWNELVTKFKGVNNGR